MPAPPALSTGAPKVAGVVVHDEPFQDSVAAPFDAGYAPKTILAVDVPVPVPAALIEFNVGVDVQELPSYCSDLFVAKAGGPVSPPAAIAAV